MLFMGAALTGLLMVPPVLAQSVEARHWQGAAAITRQPEHVVATTVAEWRSLWSRVGTPAPDMFEAGRMNAVGIFLGRRGGEGYAVNILSTARRHLDFIKSPMMQASLKKMAARCAARSLANSTSLPGSP